MVVNRQKVDSNLCRPNVEEISNKTRSVCFVDRKALLDAKTIRLNARSTKFPLISSVFTWEGSFVLSLGAVIARLKKPADIQALNKYLAEVGVSIDQENSRPDRQIYKLRISDSSELTNEFELAHLLEGKEFVMWAEPEIQKQIDHHPSMGVKN